MKMLVFAVMDVVVGAFMAPFFCQAKGQAVRMFSDLVNDPSTTVSRHPEDYRLYYLGEFDQVAGGLVSAEVPELLAGGQQFIGKVATREEAREVLRGAAERVAAGNLHEAGKVLR